MLTDRQQRGVRLSDHHANEMVAAAQSNSADAAGVAACRPHIRLGEANRHPLGGGEHKLIPGAGDHSVNKLITLTEFDRDQALGAATTILFERRLLHHATAGGQEEALIFFLKARDRPALRYPLSLLKLEQIDQGAALGIASEFGQLENPHREDFSERCEHQQPVVGTRHKEVLDGIVSVALGAFEALATPLLSPVGIGRRSLHIAIFGDRDHHRCLGDQLRHIADIGHVAADFGPPRICVLGLEGHKLLTDQGPDVGFAGEDPAELSDLAKQLAVLAGKPLLLQIDQLAEREPQHSVRLNRRKPILLLDASLLLQNGEALAAKRPLKQRRRGLNAHQPLLRLGLRRRRADDTNHLVDVGQGDEQALKRVLAAAGLREQVLRAAANDRRAMPEKLFKQLFERQHPRLAVDERQKDQRERRLQRRVLVELVEDHVRIRVPLELKHQPHRLFEVALVADRRNPLDPIIADELGDLLLNRIAGLLVGNLRDHDAVAVFAKLLNVGTGSQRDCAAACQIATQQPLAAHHDAAGGKIRARNDLDQLGHRNARLVDQPHQPPADLAKIVRGNARRHANSDTTCPVDKQIREPARQNHRLAVALIVGRHIVDRIELQIVEHQRGDRRKASLGVSHGGRGQAGNRTKVALLIHEHMPHVPFLGHADERGVDHAFAVWVIVAAGVAGNLGALHPPGARREVEIVHRDENPSLRWLETISHVRQGPTDDHAHRVGQIAVFELLLNGQLHNPPASRIPTASRIGPALPVRSIRRLIIRRIAVVGQGRAPGWESFWGVATPKAT